jgi:hypothetical protein
VDVGTSRRCTSNCAILFVVLLVEQKAVAASAGGVLLSAVLVSLGIIFRIRSPRGARRIDCKAEETGESVSLGDLKRSAARQAFCLLVYGVLDAIFVWIPVNAAVIDVTAAVKLELMLIGHHGDQISCCPWKCQENS